MAGWPVYWLNIMCQWRRDMVLIAVVLMSALLSPVAFAEEESEGEVKSMLDAIPEIVSPQAPEEDKKDQVEPEGMDLDGYFVECRKAVYAHFKMPKKIARSNPSVEIAFLVTVDSEGYIVAVTTPKRSGFKAWDKAALDALNKVGQLPAPPQGWNSSIDKVLIPFNKRSR